jgi:hypothetical protein
MAHTAIEIGPESRAGVHLLFTGVYVNLVELACYNVSMILTHLRRTNQIEKAQV